MRNLSSFFFLALPALIFGQITIGPEDMPAVNDTLAYSVAQPTEVDLQATGPSHIWDLSGLVPMMDDQEILVAVSATPFLYQFYFNNPILFPDHVASFARQGPDLDFQLLTLENVYEYFRNNSTAFRNVGFGATVNGIPTSVRRQPVDVIYEFPLEFGNESSSFSAWEISIPTTLYFEQEQMRENIVDGWGTLYLPADTFEVLRVRSVLARHDSIFVDQFGIGTAFDEPETVEYKWLAVGMGRPVLAITTVAGEPVSIEFHRSGDISTNTTAIEEPQQWVMYPNPAADVLHFRSPYPVHGRLQVRDIQGKVVLVSDRLNGAASWRIAVGALPAGSYTVELEGHTPWQGRFMVAH